MLRLLKMIGLYAVTILLCCAAAFAEAAEFAPAAAHKIASPSHIGIVGASGCSTTGATAAISLSNVPSRLTGVAPLAVFFDATATTATTAKRPFHDLEYRWNFGDPASGTWANGAQPRVSSKNMATGPVAAHIYEQPGSYKVTLEIKDGQNSVTNNCTLITVDDPDEIFASANTACFSTSGNFTNCPAGAKNITTTNFVTALSTYQRSSKRLLFRRGEIFTAPESGRITTTGPGIVGAFGEQTQPLPIIQVSGSFAAISLSDRATSNLKDWRVMDLHLNGSGAPAAEGVGFSGGIDQVTLLRLTARKMRSGFHSTDTVQDWWNNNGRPGHKIWDQLAIVDSTVNSPSLGVNSYGVALAADRLFFAGNSVDLENAPHPVVHVVRLFYTSKAVISNNTLQRPGQATSGGHVMKLHAPTWSSTGAAHNGVGGGYSRWIAMSDNKFIGGSADAWTNTIGPQNNISDERVRDVIVERNWYVAGPATQALQYVWASDVTLRNNIWDASGSYAAKGLVIGQRGIEPPPDSISVFNNSYYTNYTGQITSIAIQPTATNVTVKNNLAYAPSAASPSYVISGTGASGFAQLNNSTDVQLRTANPFTAAPADWTPAGYAIGSGTTVPVWSDFYRNNRPQSGVPGTIDLGAAEVP